ncbi:MAG: NADH-quinone oxidoreductase subunit H [Planctomycetes bacterium]|nr:NADH-quinone oxidoreductase subunit H [Planctomycetota bacterium]
MQLIQFAHGLLPFLAKWPDWVVYLAVVFLFAFAILNTLVAPLTGISTYIERRLAGRAQYRWGPNRVGIRSLLAAMPITRPISKLADVQPFKFIGSKIPGGLLQFAADGLKLFTKEDIIPAQADKMLFRLSPYVVMAGSFAAFAVFPVSFWCSAINLNIGIFYVLGMSSVVVPGILMAGWGSANKWALFGGMRSASQIVSYEIPVAIALMTVVMLAGTMNMNEIVATQRSGYGIEKAGFLGWYLFRYGGLMIVPFVIYFIGGCAEVNRTPFDLPEGESELVSGYHTEYSGFRWSFFFMAEYSNMFAVGAIATTMFLGGPLPPYPVQFTESLPMLIRFGEGFFWFFAKSYFFVLVMIHMRWTLPRYRIDQLMQLCWKVLMPIALVWFVLMCGIKMARMEMAAPAEAPVVAEVHK